MELSSGEWRARYNNANERKTFFFVLCFAFLSPITQANVKQWKCFHRVASEICIHFSNGVRKIHKAQHIVYSNFVARRYDILSRENFFSTKTLTHTMLTKLYFVVAVLIRAFYTYSEPKGKQMYKMEHISHMNIHTNIPYICGRRVAPIVRRRRRRRWWRDDSSIKYT